jgi:hypothetical protein
MALDHWPLSFDFEKRKQSRKDLYERHHTLRAPLLHKVHILPSQDSLISGSADICDWSEYYKTLNFYVHVVNFLFKAYLEEELS